MNDLLKLKRKINEQVWTWITEEKRAFLEMSLSKACHY